MRFSRRSLLQITGLGLLQWLLAPRMGSKYLEAIASPGDRKLALLIGINNYGADFPSLRGAVTDVELQRELLIARFGFQNADILTLTDTEASQSAILNAFNEHLIKQAQAGDGVIIHFSGYGSEVNLGTTETPLLANTLVTADNCNNFLEENILTLSRSLGSDNYTLVLDTSHRNNPQSLQSRWGSRSLPVSPSLKTPQDMALPTSMALTTKKTINGTILKSVSREQTATELIGSDWSAGVFTYCLTQYLWEVMPASRITIALGEVSQKIRSLRDKQQEAQLITDVKSPPLTYYAMTAASSSGEAVVSEIIDKQTVEINLTGIDPEILEVYEKSSVLALSDKPEITLQIISRIGIKAKGQLLTIYPVEIGQVWREQVRVLPQTIGLIVGFDNSLSRIERVDATSALATFKPLVRAVNGEELFIDCLLTKIDKTDSYALSLPGGILIDKSVGIANEAVKSAIKRLNPHLEKILADKIWRLTQNENSAVLKVSATLEKELPISETFLIKITRDFSKDSCEAIGKSEYLAKNSKCVQNYSSVTLKETKIISFSPTNDIKYKIRNGESITLYSLLVIIDGSGKTNLITGSDENESNSLIPLTIPARSTLTINLKTPNVIGTVKSYLINCVAPFPKTISLLNSNHTPSKQTQQLISIDNPLAVAQSVWQDLSAKKEIKSDTGASTLTAAFELDKWATLSFIYQVVD